MIDSVNEKFFFAWKETDICMFLAICSRLAPETSPSYFITENYDSIDSLVKVIK